MRDPSSNPRHRWVMLAVGVLAQAGSVSFIYGLPAIVPALRHDLNASLFEASVIVSAPIAGLLCTLIAWGALADRIGERIVIGTGTALAAVLVGATSLVHNLAAIVMLLALAGACGASVNAASGRMVMGWFSPQQRGLAMGIRQSSQPLGVALAALVLPPLAQHVGALKALDFSAIFCGIIALAVFVLVVDPPRPATFTAEETASPYRQATIWRVHVASACLVVPQFAISAFTVVYLVGQRGWSPVAAGQLAFVFQLAGAGARVLSGIWSDRVGSRMRPIRQLAVASAVLMLSLAVGAWTDSGWIIAVFAAAAVVTVADNGLAYIAVAEIAGPAWTGRALGVENTGQNIASLLTAPALAAIIGDTRYGLAFALVAVVPSIAVSLVPVKEETVPSS